MVLADGHVGTRVGTAGQREPQCIRAEAVDPVERIDAVAPRLGHLLAELIANQSVQEDISERNLWALLSCGDGVVGSDVGAEHHHPGDPEEQNVVAGDEYAGRVELLQFGSGLRPAHRREGPQAGREPGVEDVGVLLPPLGWGLPRSQAHRLAVGAVPDRNSVAPPQLTRDAPIVHVVDPGEPARLLTLGMNDGVAVANCVTGRLGQGVDLDPPLQRQTRLDRLTAALGVSDAVQVRALLGDHSALLGQGLTDLDTRLESVHTVELRSGIGDAAGLVHDRRHRQ